jgi:hypothetical protein
MPGHHHGPCRIRNEEKRKTVPLMDPNIRLRRSVYERKNKNKCNETDAERWKYKKDEKLISKWSKLT